MRFLLKVLASVAKETIAHRLPLCAMTLSGFLGIGMVLYSHELTEAKLDQIFWSVQIAITISFFASIVIPLNSRPVVLMEIINPLLAWGVWNMLLSMFIAPAHQNSLLTIIGKETLFFYLSRVVDLTLTLAVIRTMFSFHYYLLGHAWPERYGRL